MKSRKAHYTLYTTSSYRLEAVHGLPPVLPQQRISFRADARCLGLAVNTSMNSTSMATLSASGAVYVGGVEAKTVSEG